MANCNLTPNDVRAICNELEVSPSKNDSVSGVYGLRKSANESHSKTSHDGDGLVSNGFHAEDGKGTRKSRK